MIIKNTYLFLCHLTLPYHDELNNFNSFKAQQQKANALTFY